MGLCSVVGGWGRLELVGAGKGRRPSSSSGREITRIQCVTDAWSRCGVWDEGRAGTTSRGEQAMSLELNAEKGSAGVVKRIGVRFLWLLSFTSGGSHGCVHCIE